MSLLYPAGQTPYLTREELLAAPTGISWSTLPAGANVTDQQRIAEQLNVLGRATARVDGYCNQPLRATVDNEQVTGPNFRATVQVGTGNGRIILSRWPILSIISVQVAPSTVFPRQWTSIPAGQWDIEVPPVSVYGTVAPSAAADGGQAILIPPGWLNWCNGRNGWTIRISYVNGWPHTSLTSAVSPGATSIPVDDCTGWAITGEFGQLGAAGVVYDSGQQETVQVTAASATAGPGTLTLSSALQFSHANGVMVTTMPQSVIDAMIEFAKADALIRGATSTTLKQIPGQGGGSGKSMGPQDYIKAGNCLIHPFRRTI